MAVFVVGIEPPTVNAATLLFTAEAVTAVSTIKSEFSLFENEAQIAPRPISSGRIVRAKILLPMANTPSSTSTA